MNEEEARAFLDSVKQWADPIIVLTGGEPLYRPDCLPLARHASDLGLMVALATNGTLITDSIARDIQASGVRRVSISLDGADAETHDTFRGVPGAYDAAIAGLKRLREIGVSVQVNMTVAKHNVDQLDEALDKALALGCDAFHIFCLVPVGCGLQIAETQQIEGERYEQALTWLARKSQEVDINLRATCAPHYFRLLRQTGAKVSPPHGGERLHAATRGCLAGSGVCFVSNRGDVQPCGYLPLVVGNVRRRNLRDIWNESPEFALLRQPDELKGKCGCCEYRTLCMGCRARAYACTGNYLAPEPYCVYEPGATKRASER